MCYDVYFTVVCCKDEVAVLGNKVGYSKYFLEFQNVDGILITLFKSHTLHFVELSYYIEPDL